MITKSSFYGHGDEAAHRKIEIFKFLGYAFYYSSPYNLILRPPYVFSFITYVRDLTPTMVSVYNSTGIVNFFLRHPLQLFGSRCQFDIQTPLTKIKTRQNKFLLALLSRFEIRTSTIISVAFNHNHRVILIIIQKSDEVKVLTGVFITTHRSTKDVKERILKF